MTQPTTVEQNGLILSRTAPLEQGRYPGFGSRVVEDAGMRIEYDVPVALRDGVKMYVDIYRPSAPTFATGPTLMGWSPYGKHGFKTLGLMPGADVDPSWISKYTIWEGPDPVFWCGQGYVIVNPDPRGAWSSEGTLGFWTRQEARDGADVIEWIAQQPWSNGRVGLLGVSYLAISQWSIASERPPHLAAICPWEGLSDVYRELAYHGGIPERLFMEWWQPKSRFSAQPAEDILAMQERHQLIDAYWVDKEPKLEDIVAPAYVVASWCDHGMHTRGTLEGFKRIGSEHKWLEIHDRKKWRHFWDPQSVARQKQFFDQFLLETDSSVMAWPRVRLEVRDSPNSGFRPEREWPLERTRYERLYLDAARSSMQPTEPNAESTATYQTTVAGAQRTFDYTFTHPTELIGHVKLKLWMSCEVGDEIDVFVALQKLDAQGKVVGFRFFSMYDDGPVGLGWLRASHRELDPERTTEYQPWHTHRSAVPLRPGEIVPLEIEIWPTGVHFATGEALRVVVAGNDIYRFDSVGPQDLHETRNAGAHAIHTGGPHDSHLLIPVIPGV